MSGACFRRWEMDGDETPQVSTSHTGTAIFNLPVPPGIQPGTFGGPLAPLCSRHPPDANTVRVSTATQCIHLGTRIVMPRPHARSREKSEAPVEPESQADTAESAATGTCPAAAPGQAGFPACPHRKC